MPAVVPLASGARVLVVGDLMLDVYTQGRVDRISPEAPVPVVVRAQDSYLPGGAANSARNAAGLGCRVQLHGIVGADDAGGCLSEVLTAAEVDVRGVLLDPAVRTTVKHRVVAAGQQIVRIDTEPGGPPRPEVLQQLVAEVRTAVPAADGILISDYGKGVCTPELCDAVLTAARDAGRPVVVDPKSHDFSRYHGATVLTPNTSEATVAAGLPSGASLDEVGWHLVGVTEAAVLLTRGPDGMTLYHGGEVVHLPTTARQVYDVTGAGDTVAATVTTALAGGWPLPAAARLANEAAGLAVGRHGTVAIRREELAAVIEGLRGEACT